MNTSRAQDLLGDFEITPTNESRSQKEMRVPVTLWLPADDKARYDQLQNKTKRRFSKKAREVLIELIGLAEDRLSNPSEVE